MGGTHAEPFPAHGGMVDTNDWTPALFFVRVPALTTMTSPSLVQDGPHWRAVLSCAAFAAVSELSQSAASAPPLSLAMSTLTGAKPSAFTTMLKVLAAWLVA